MKKALQHFDPKILAEAKNYTPEDIVEFIEEFRELQAAVTAQKKPTQPSILISMKVPKDLLESFRQKAKKSDVPYQTQIKRLMQQWLRQG